MEKFKLNINGKEVKGLPGQTILEVARENDIFIPTLCYDERTKIYGSCGICMCEVEGNPKLCKACATVIAPGMVIRTNTERVIESRKTNLELLLSNHTGDCRPPCVLACPAQTDCQGYVGLIANGEYEAALELVKDKIPLPAALGRVCPHPCEEKCRRGLIDEPISIQWLKRFVADNDLMGEEAFIPECEPATGKRVAVIGGGNSGLEAALDLAGITKHVTVLEFLPELKADQVLQERAAKTDNLTILKNVATKEIVGQGHVTGLNYVERDTNAEKHLDLEGVFVQIGLVPSTAWLKDSGIELNERQEIIVDKFGSTNIPGIFAAGDCTDSAYKQIIISMGSGATAAIGAFDYLIRQ